MQIDVTKVNFNLLWNHIEDSHLTDFGVSEGELKKRSFLDKLFYRAQLEEVKSVILKTLEDGIQRLESEKLVYVSKISTSIFDAEALYAPKFPVYYLAEKIKKHPDFQNDTAIINLANRILELKDHYPDSTFKDGVLKGMDDPKVLHWDETELT